LSEDTQKLDRLRKEMKELNQMYVLAQTSQAQKSLAQMKIQKQDELLEFFNEIFTRKAIDFNKAGWVNRERYQ